MYDGGVGRTAPTRMNETPLDRDGFARLYDRMFPKIYTYLLYALADAASADEAVSVVFEKALAGFASFDPARGPVEGWLFGIARNAARDQYRSRRRWGWLPFELLAERPDAGPKVEDALIGDESNRALVGALKQLDERERLVLALKFSEGLSNREIASREGLEDGNVGVIVHRAVKKLQAALGEEGRS